jgi:glucosamine--fructose-6-phosphate aminotransferase (isomerizing)
MNAKPTRSRDASPSSLLLAEAAQAPDVVARLLDANRKPLERLVAELERRPPAFAATVARGSSDNAADFARYCLESALGLVTASVAPSTVTRYGADLRLENGLLLAISQSGESPDLLAVVEQARRRGAITVAIVNREDSPLAALCAHCLPMQAGAERSTGATKSFIASLAAILALVAAWGRDAELGRALHLLPDLLRQAHDVDGSPAVPLFAGARSAFVLGRGRSYPIAREIALKLKELAALHAEAFSAAEVMHGPLALLSPGFPVLAVGAADATEEGLRDAMLALRGHGAIVAGASASPLLLQAADIPVALPAAPHPALDPIVAAQAAYGLVHAVALARGHDPDAPRHITKVTKTL